MLKEASKTSDAKARAVVDRNKALFDYRERTATPVNPSLYDCNNEMKRKHISLSDLAWKLHGVQHATATLRTLPTFIAAMETSKTYRVETNYKKLMKAFTKGYLDENGLLQSIAKEEIMDEDV